MSIGAEGIRIGLFLSKVYARLLRPGLSELPAPNASNNQRPLAKAIQRVETLIHQNIQEAQLVLN